MATTAHLGGTLFTAFVPRLAAESCLLLGCGEMELSERFSLDQVIFDQPDLLGFCADYPETSVPPPESSPTSYLDRAICRVALLRAREFLAKGYSKDEAVRLSCTGSWSQWRVFVREQLEAIDHRSV
jgi:hypothetical protein